jgi:hypothetical protein
VTGAVVVGPAVGATVRADVIGEVHHGARLLAARIVDVGELDVVGPSGWRRRGGAECRTPVRRDRA